MYFVLIKYGFQDNFWIKLMQTRGKKSASATKQYRNTLFVPNVIVIRVLGDET